MRPQPPDKPQRNAVGTVVTPDKTAKYGQPCSATGLPVTLPAPLQAVPRPPPLRAKATSCPARLGYQQMASGMEADMPKIKGAMLGN